MTTDLINYIADNQLVQNNQKTLLAVSGGIDSIVLCHLFKQINFPFAIAHCNFKLRAEDSDEDEIFVKEIANQLEVPFFSIAFDTEKIAAKKKQSIQVAARELRYDWLEEIRAKNGYDFIATAHHLNDSIETVLYNFTKGCGIRGLHGILPKNGNIIRPLLFSTKKEIEKLAIENELNWREDVSNATDKYARNKIRHHVVPVLKDLNSVFEKTVGENLIRLQETEKLYEFAVKQIKEEIIRKEDNLLKIHIQKLQQTPAPSSVLFEILNPFGFHNRQITQILAGFVKPSSPSVGNTFFSQSHCLLVDRTHLILKENSENEVEHTLIYAKDESIQLSDGILVIQKNQNIPAQFSRNSHQTYMDADKISFPLKIRKWKAGDTFQPLGMNGKHQKLQDFFSNNKLTRFEKEAVWILENKGEICWIVGYRLDERYKITNQTQNCLFFAFE